MIGEAFIGDLIHGLRRRDVRLWVDKGQLSVDAPKGALQQEDIQQLRAHKEEILAFLDRVAQRFEPPPLLPLPKIERPPLSLSQQRFWIVDQLAGSQGVRAMRYHLPQAVRVRGPLDDGVLQRALDELMRRHELLRTTFATADGVPYQAIAAHANFELKRIDLGAEPAAQREAALERCLEQEMHRAVDLRVGPLIRGCLIRMDADDHALFITMHHIVTDGWSLQLTWREIGALYADFLHGTGSTLAPVKLQYADYARWERGWLHGTVLENLLGYWKRKLADVEVLELARDKVLPEVPSFRGACHVFVISAQQSAALRALANELRASLFMTVFAVFHLLLSRTSGQRDFAVSTPVAGRHHPGTEDLIGACVNNLVLRVAAEPGMTFRQLLLRVRTVVLDGYGHQDLPYEQLIAWMRADEVALGNVSFALNIASRDPPKLPELRVDPVLLPWFTAKNELTLSVQETPQEIFGVFEYSCDSFEAETIERYGRRFLRALDAILADADVPLDAIDITLEGEAAYRHSAQYLEDRAYWAAQRGVGQPVSLSVSGAARRDATPLQARAALDAELCETLAACAAACDVALADLLLAAAVLYVHKASGATAPRVGVDSAPTLPVAFDVGETTLLAEFVRDAAARVAAARRHGGCGADVVRQVLGAPDAPAYCTAIELGAGASGGDAELSIRLAAEVSSAIEFVGSAHKFAAWELEAHANAFTVLLRQLTPASLALEVRALGLLDAAGRAQVLAWAAGARSSAPAQTLVQQLIEAQVKRTPEALALLQDETRLSYRELNARANRLAHHLRSLGVGPGQRVVVCLERDTSLIASLLGVLKSGAAYIPVDTVTAAERLAHVFVDAQPAAIVTHSRLAHLLPRSSARMVVLDRDAAAIARRSAANPKALAAENPLAYIIYTSGSSGEPKGVMVSHANLINHARWAQREFALGGDDRALQFASISFDASAEEIFPTLISGAAVVMRQAAVPSAAELLHAILEQGITVLNLPTAYWHAWVEALGEQPIASGALRLIIVGGERVSLESLQRWRMLAGSAVAWVNTYGPTEATISATLYRAPPDVSALDDIPIGRPIDNACAYLLDAAGTPVPVGVVGELCLGGAGVTCGYLGRSELSAQKFALDPFALEAGARLYRSGDRARWLPDGNIAYVGRNDDQVKLRGFRIEPGEIEVQLRRCEHVREAAVLLREDTLGDKRLVAYVACAPAQQANLADALRDRLRQLLPAYMVPQAFVLLDALPMTLNGKLDRRALPVPPRAAEAHAYAAPEGEVEQALAQIWQDALRVARVGRHDNFFDLGGSSINAIQIIGRANQAGIKLNLHAIFEQQTIAKLAQHLTHGGDVPRASLGAKRLRTELQAPERGSIAGAVAFTPIQLDTLRQGEDAVRSLVSTHVLSCRRAVAPELLETALRKLVVYHDALRLAVTCDAAGTWSQVIAPAARVAEWTLLARETLGEGEAIEAALTAALERLRARIDSRRGPLLQATLIATGADSPQLLLLGVHHFAIDPVSWSILLQDLETLCTQLESAAALRLPPKGASLKQWGEAIASYANGSDAARELAYWRAQYAKPHAELPPGDAAESEEAQAQCVTVRLDAARTSALLGSAARAHVAQVNEILLAALVHALRQWTGQQRFALGAYHHGRSSAFGALDVSRTLGWFSTPVPLLLGAAADATIEAMLAAVKHELATMPHEGVGHAIVRALHSGDEPLPPAPIDVLLNHQGTLSGEAPGGLFATHFDNSEYAGVLRQVALPWKIALLSNIAEECLCANFVSSRYSRDTLQAVADSFRIALCTLAATSPESS